MTIPTPSPMALDRMAPDRSRGEFAARVTFGLLIPWRQAREGASGSAGRT
jgi:hypothetical protein